MTDNASKTRWATPDDAAQDFISMANAVTMAFQERKDDLIASSRYEMASSAIALEADQSLAAQTLSVLASQLARIALGEANRGEYRLVTALHNGSLTQDITADEFVKLYLERGVASETDNERLELQTKKALAKASKRLLRQPTVAATGVRKLADRISQHRLN